MFIWKIPAIPGTAQPGVIMSNSPKSVSCIERVNDELALAHTVELERARVCVCACVHGLEMERKKKSVYTPARIDHC